MRAWRGQDADARDVDAGELPEAGGVEEPGEARGEPVDGRLDVAEVGVHRARHPSEIVDDAAQLIGVDAENGLEPGGEPGQRDKGVVDDLLALAERGAQRAEVVDHRLDLTVTPRHLS